MAVPVCTGSSNHAWRPCSPPPYLQYNSHSDVGNPVAWDMSSRESPTRHAWSKHETVKYTQQTKSECETQDVGQLDPDHDSFLMEMARARVKVPSCKTQVREETGNRGQG